MADAKILSEFEIGNSLVDTTIAQTNLTDMSDGSILSILLRGAVAPEIHAAYLASLTIADNFYVGAASGTALKRRLADFGISEGQASSAYGVARFSRVANSAGDVVIPSGFAVSLTSYDGTTLQYTTRAESTIPAGVEYVDAVIDASSPGAGHNSGAAPLSFVSSAPASLASAAIVNAITTGKDADGDEELRNKFNDWLTMRTRGTLASLRVAATSYSVTDSRGVTTYPVGSAATEEHLSAAGPNDAAVSLYVFGVNGASLTDAEIAGVQQRIDGYTQDGVDVEGYRPAGIKVNVARPDTVAVDIRVDVTLSATGTSQDVAQLKSRLTALVASLPIGLPLKIKDVFGQVIALGSAFDNARIIEPAGDVSVLANQKLTLGVLAVSG